MSLLKNPLPLRKYTKSDTERVCREYNKRAQIVSTMIQTTSSNKKGGLLDRIKAASISVEREFKNEKDLYTLVLEEDLLAHYIDTANNNGILTLDNETSGLNPIVDILAGTAFYTEGLNACYVPINHVSQMSGERLKDQLTAEILTKHLKRLDKDVKTIYHNAKFDLRVFKNQLKIDLFEYLWWDTMIASCLLDENEPHDLKYLYGKYCAGGDVAKFKALFKDIPFQFVPMEIGYLYAAKDAKMTYDLFKFQEPYLTAEDEKCRSKGLEKVALYYQYIELPFIDSLCEMEDAGCEIDVKHLEDLSVKLHKELKIKEKAFRDACLPFDVEIHKYKLNNTEKNKLDDPILISSPVQVSILLYDILKCESVDKKKPKSTEAPILVKLKNKYKDDKDKINLIDCLIGYRHIEKLLTTYVDSIPKLINPVTGRLHTEFTQHVTRTGRLSSKEPNFQNLPVRSEVGKEVRKAFKAGEDELMLFADYSQQEPRILAYVSLDEGLLQAYKEGKDIYAHAGSFTFKIEYIECLENYEDGTPNPEGNKRRSSMKAIVLGIMYEKQPVSIAEDLGISKKEAQALYDMFFEAFPGVKTFRENLMNFVEEHGYVEMINGMRRGRIPDMTLPKYEITRVSEGNDFDPLDGIDDLDFDDDSNSNVNSKVAETELIVDDETYDEYYQAMNKAWGFQKKREIIDRAAEEGIKIVDNSFKIQEAIRQIVNTVIQGSASIITKNACVKLNASRVAKLRGRRTAFYKQLEPYIARSTYLKNNNVILAIQVHDELIMRCKKVIAKEVKKITVDIMIESAGDLITVPMKVDCDVSERWLGEKIEL